MYNTKEQAEGIKKQTKITCKKRSEGVSDCWYAREREREETKKERKKKRGISYIQWVCERCYNGQCESMRGCQAMSKICMCVVLVQ
jgi:hypothetical protein